MKKLRIIHLSFFLVGFIICQASTMSGHIIDSQTLASLSFANVILFNGKDSSYVAGSTTDQHGEFRFDVQPQFESGFLKVSLLGYKTTRIVFHSLSEIRTIMLNPTDITLQDVNIIGHKPTFTLQDGSIMVNTKDIPLNKTDNGFDVLRLTPTVFVNNENVIRILDKPATIIMDGKRLSDMQIQSVLSSLKAENIKSLKVQSASSPDKDSNIEGGVISITTKSPERGLNSFLSHSVLWPQKPFCTQTSLFNMSYGSTKWRIYGDFSLTHGTNKWYDKNNSVTYNYTSINKKIIEKDNSEAHPKEYNYSIGSMIDLSSKQTLGIEFSEKRLHSHSQSSNFSTIDSLLQPIDFLHATASFDNTTKLYNPSAFYQWTIDSLASQVKILANLLFSRENTLNLFNSQYEQAYSQNSLIRNASGQRTNNGSIQIDISKNLDINTNLSFGIKSSVTQRTSYLLSETYANDIWNQNNNTTNYNYREHICAAYMSFKKKISGINFYSGIRVEGTNLSGSNMQNNSKENVDRNYINIFPFLNTSYKWHGSTIGFNYSTSINRPYFTFLSAYSNKVSDFLYDVGNPLLMPSYTNRIQLNFKKGNHYLSLYGRHISRVHSEIWTIRGDTTFHSNDNNGNALYCGATYALSGQMYKWWYLNLNTNIYHSYFSHSYYKRHYNTLNLTLNNKIDLTQNSSFSLSATYCTPSIAANTLMNSKYWVDIAYNQSFFQNNLNIHLGLNDIFNTISNRSSIVIPNLKYTLQSKALTRNLELKLSYSIESKKKINKTSMSKDLDIINRL